MDTVLITVLTSKLRGCFVWLPAFYRCILTMFPSPRRCGLISFRAISCVSHCFIRACSLKGHSTSLPGSSLIYLCFGSVGKLPDSQGSSPLSYLIPIREKLILRARRQGSIRVLQYWGLLNSIHQSIPSNASFKQPSQQFSLRSTRCLASFTQQVRGQSQAMDSSQDTGGFRSVGTVPRSPRTCARKQESCPDLRLVLHQVRRQGCK